MERLYVTTLKQTTQNNITVKLEFVTTGENAYDIAYQALLRLGLPETDAAQVAS